MKLHLYMNKFVSNLLQTVPAVKIGELNDFQASQTLLPIICNDNYTMFEIKQK